MLNLTLQKIKSLRHPFSLGLMLSLVTLFSSCGKPLYTYQPELNLEKSSLTIHKTVHIKAFKDNRIKERKRQNIYSLTDAPSFNKDLSTEVTNALKNDFSNNLVFKSVTKQLDSADYVLVGEITNFNSTIRPTTGAYISMYSIVGIFFMPFTGINFNKMEANIGLTMKMYSKDGLLVGTYTGNSSILEKASIYESKKMHNFHKQTNANFSNAVLQIREQILKDASKFDK